MAAQSAWLADENEAVGLAVGEPGITPDVRKRVTSLTPPPVGLDMVLLALLKRREQEKELDMNERGRLGGYVLLFVTDPGLLERMHTRTLERVAYSLCLAMTLISTPRQHTNTHVHTHTHARTQTHTRAYTGEKGEQAA